MLREKKIRVRKEVRKLFIAQRALTYFIIQTSINSIYVLVCLNHYRCRFIFQG